jgi:myo-inositol-1(or 4)-monophosphatase
MTSLAERLGVATAIMSKASPVALDLFNRRAQFALEEKSPNEFVSKADRTVEEFIRQNLGAALPGDAVLGEEDGGEAGSAFWSIDPIDGTSNFLRGSPLWGVSLGYMEHGRSRVGVIHFPALGMVLSAASGSGLQFQGRPFDRNVPFADVKVAAVGDSTRWKAADIGNVEGALRRTGSGVALYRCATVGLGFAALGYLDGYVEQYLSVWDLAAGAVICEEAGLKVAYGGTHAAQSMWIRAGTDAVHAATSALVPAPGAFAIG